MRGNPRPPIPVREVGDQREQGEIKKNNIREGVALAWNSRKDQRFRADRGKKANERTLGEPY